MSETKKAKTEARKVESGGLYRSENSKIIAGVAGGLGEYFNVDATIIRVLFILLTVFGGSGVIVYIVLWLIIPSRSHSSADSRDAIRSNLEDMKTTTRTFAHNIRNSGSVKENSKFWWAIIIILVGFFFLMDNFGLLGSFELEKLWPLVLIIFGLAIILRK